MYKIIGDNNRVNYGSIDEPVDFNYHDFRLLNIFEEEITGLKKKYALHAFNYMAIVTGDYLIGMAVVDLHSMANVLVFVFNYEKGKVYEYDGLTLSRKLHFPVNPDEYDIHFRNRKGHCSISKSHAKGLLEIDVEFGKMLTIKGSFPYSLKTHSPLRVLNPSCGDPHRFTFTEKCAPIAPRSLDISLCGKPLPVDLKETMLLYDWSGGYLNRNTNWLWAAFAGARADGTTIGANFAALVNETWYSENAFWINNKRTRVQRAIFDFDTSDPAREWRIWSEDGQVDITARPSEALRRKSNFGIVKINFRQFVCDFSGKLKTDKGPAVTFTNVRGLTEIHFAVW